MEIDVIQLGYITAFELAPFDGTGFASGSTAAFLSNTSIFVELVPWTSLVCFFCLDKDSKEERGSRCLFDSDA